jgi:uncharacterized membrane protein YjjB (DUF3815 family)
MTGGALPFEWLGPATFVAALLLTLVTRWRIWITALAISIVALIIGAVLHPILVELGNGIAAFVSALAGGALGSIVRRKRTA